LYYEHIIVDNISTDKTLDIVKKFNSITEVNKQFRTLVNWLGYKQINIPIKINERTSGKSKYNFISLFQLAVNNFTSFSLFPIKLIGWIGLFMTFFSIILVLIMLLDNIFLSNQLKINIQSIFLIIQILLTGVMLSSIAFLGLYISKILNNTNNRPSYIIEKKI
jgi:dolichol-phosphate mannosyltransferase